MRLLKLLSWQYVRKHVLRSVLTTTGIVLGVALFVAMHAANQSILGAFNRTVTRIAGATQLQVTAGEAGFAEEVLERVQSAPEVRVAVPVIEAVVDTGLRGQGNLMILAIDMTGDRSLRDYTLEAGDEDVVEDPLVFLAQPDSLIVTREFAERNGFAVGSKIPLNTMAGRKLFTIRGIMRSGGLASAFGGNLAVMDIYAAQTVFGRGRRFDRIDLALKEGVSLEQGQIALRKLLGPGFEVEPPSSRGQQFESLLSVYTISMNISSLVALFVGMFIIFNSFSIAVTQRRFEIGILRALGATRRQIRALFLIESAVAGLVGALVGVAVGVAMAKGLSAYLSKIFDQVYGVGEWSGEVALQPRLLLAAIVIGTLTSMFAAVIPARNAAKVDPVRALQKGKYQVLTAGENRVRRMVALLLAAGSGVLLVLGRSTFSIYFGYALMLMTALLLMPTLALWLSRLLRPALKWARPVEGALAADSLIQAPRRTSGTVSALMLSLSLVIGLGGVARASYNSIREWLDTTLNPDMFISPSETLAGHGFRFPAEMETSLASIEGVAEVQPVRVFRVQMWNTPILLLAADLAKVAARTRSRRVVAGDFDQMHRLASEGKGVIVAETLIELQKLHMGDELQIPTPSGILRMPIAGVLKEFGDQHGTIYIDRSILLHYWKDDSADVFRIYLKPGASAAVVKRRILEKFEHERRLFVLLNQDVKTDILRITDQWFGMTYMQIFVAVVVAVLGIVNTLTVSITDRKRELGVLRAVGGLRHQVRGAVWLEAFAIGAVGLILGLAVGAFGLFYQIRTARDLGGLVLDYQYPRELALLLVPVMLGAAFVAALWPAEAAVRASLVEALEYE